MKLLLFDLDETILRSDPGIMCIRKRNDEGEWRKVTSLEFAAGMDGGDAEYDFSDFYDRGLVYASILSAQPIPANLKIVDDYAALGYKAAFLTARASEAAIKKAMKKWLKIRYEKKDLSLDPSAFFLADESIAINDEKYLTSEAWRSASDAEKKAEAVRRATKKYEEVIFLDDDERNIEAAQDLRLPNVIVVKAARV